MIDAQLPLQAAIVAAIKADPALNALIVGRVYDRVPTNSATGHVTSLFPYVSLGPMQSVDASDDCHDGVEVFVDVSGWSRDVGSVEAKQIGARLCAVLDAALTVSGFEVIVHEIQSVRTGRELDGLTTRALLQLRYVLAPVA